MSGYIAPEVIADHLAGKVDQYGEAIPRLYKIVGTDGSPVNGGSGLWPLPEPMFMEGATRMLPGLWREIEGEIEPCRNGLHLASAEQLPHWLGSWGTGEGAGNGRVIYAVETQGPVVNAGEKYVARKVRLLPHPAERMPDMAREAEKRDKALAGAVKARDKALGGIRATGYLAALSVKVLPAGHPLRAAVEARASAERSYAAAKAKADKAYQQAFARMLEQVTA